jgi:protein-arginine kinase activator protein McsA
MNRTLKTLATVASISILTACGSFGGFNSNPDKQIRNQKLQTSFNDGLKVESNCSWFGGDESCEFVSFEATVTVPALGGTGANAHTAKIRAEAQAKAKIAHYLNEKIDSNIVTTTIAKNIEKAKDSLKTDNGDTENVVTMTENEAKSTQSKNLSYRENDNNTAYGVSQTIRQFASSKLQGCTTKFSAEGQDMTAVVFCSKKNQVMAKKAYTVYNGQ